MLFDPPERNVDPLLFQNRIRTVKKLDLTLAIHDKNVATAKTAQVSFTVRTQLTLSTPGLHQGCDSPPHSDKQWPAPLTSLWPDSRASPIRT